MAEPRAGARRLTVDHDLCSGSGRCRDIAPDIFVIRDDRSWPAGNAQMTDADEDLVREAEAACPWFAISYAPGSDAPGSAPGAEM
ncbi:ferredoxin [Streptomyces sp. NPDC058247]|uniref:ferredoxin n=1 Tax=Streptomyces sp. NPDC058247 TaxID=3346401 RepID=UPI0036E2E26B